MWPVLLCGQYCCAASTAVQPVLLCSQYRCAASTAVQPVLLCSQYSCAASSAMQPVLPCDQWCRAAEVRAYCAWCIFLSRLPSTYLRPTQVQWVAEQENKSLLPRNKLVMHLLSNYLPPSPRAGADFSLSLPSSPGLDHDFALAFSQAQTLN